MMNNDSNKTTSFLILRFYFAQFWLLQCFGKIFDQESHIVAWRNLNIWSAHTAEWFVKQTILPHWVVSPYTLVLPYLEFLIGLLLLIGLKTRNILIFSALLIISLNAGLLLQLKHDIVALNTIYLIAILLAIQWENYNQWSLDSFLTKI
ncbi:MAG: DoxX family membrane protein [Elusimicrobia bacterium]|nr:DoxX family membrane protein [Elusimicrobiota bacterium]